MIIETGIFTAITKASYLSPAKPGFVLENTLTCGRWLYQVKFSLFQTFSDVRDSSDFIRDHSSRTKESSDRVCF